MFQKLIKIYVKWKDSRTMFDPNYCRKYCAGHGLVGLRDDPISHDKFCKMPQNISSLNYCKNYCTLLKIKKNGKVGIAHVPHCPSKGKEEDE